MSMGDLTSMTDKEIRRIEHYAPKRTSLPEDVNKKLNFLNCKTVEDVYEVYDELEGKNKEVWERNKHLADEILYKEVRRLSKHLMNRMVQARKDQEKGLRELIKTVLDYQEVLEEQLEENQKKRTNSSMKQGYLLFTGWTDEEIYHFWNGDTTK